MSWWAKFDPGADPAIVEAASSPDDWYVGPFDTFTEASDWLARVEANLRWEVVRDPQIVHLSIIGNTKDGGSS